MKKRIISIFIAVAVIFGVVSTTAAAPIANLTPITNGNVVDFIINASGDFDGVFLLEMSGELTLNNYQSPAGALVIYNNENGYVHFAIIEIESGETLFRLSFNGTGTWTLKGVEWGNLLHVNLSGNIGDYSDDCLDCGKYPCECADEIHPDILFWSDFVLNTIPLTPVWSVFESRYIYYNGYFDVSKSVVDMLVEKIEDNGFTLVSKVHEGFFRWIGANDDIWIYVAHNAAGTLFVDIWICIGCDKIPCNCFWCFDCGKETCECSEPPESCEDCKKYPCQCGAGGGDLNVQGNTVGNINNHGIAAIQGDWIYYNEERDFYSGLYKMRIDGTGTTKVSEYGMFINIVDDWIYTGGLQGIFKFRTDGTGRTQIIDDSVWGMIVVDDWIYYANRSDSSKLYRIRTNGTEREKLSDNTNCYSVNVVGDWIYYASQQGIYKMRIDGTEQTKLKDSPSHSIQVIDDWIYYTNSSGINRIRTDWTGNEKLLDMAGQQLTNIIVNAGWIYFNQVSLDSDLYSWEDNGIYRMRLDGSEKTKISDEVVYLGRFNVVGNWIIINDSDGKSSYTKIIRIDNTGSAPIQVATPTATPANRTFTSSVNVTLATATDGAEIYFTTNGATPTTSSTLYTTPINLTATTTIKAIAVKDGVSSGVLEVTFTRQSSSSGSSGGGGGGSTPPADTTPTTTPTVSITAGTATWTVAGIPRIALNALGLSSQIPVTQLSVQTGATGNRSVSVGVLFAGQNAILVSYNATSRELEFVSASTVGANGNANINVRETGDFLVLTFKTGDITGTGTVETGDALALLRHVAGVSELNSIQLFVANGKQGDTGTTDALNILRYIAGVIDKIN
jgi:hypothetical protein